MSTHGENGEDQRVSSEMLAFLVDDKLRLLLFGGKGGVGKTTAASATGLYRAEHEPSRQILVVSTDPAHSLGDSFGQPIGDQVTAVGGLANLFALEMDARRRYEAFERANDDVLRTIAERGTYFDQEDISQFLELSLPGLDELMAVLEVADLVRARRYDLVILDTAPTGHTLRLLSLPDVMDEWLDVLDLMLEKQRYMASVFGRYKPDETDAFLKRTGDDVRRLRDLLADPELCAFVPVTIPEAMAIEETARLLESLRELRVRAPSVIVNRVVPEGGDAFSASRREAQRRHLEAIEHRFAGCAAERAVVRVPWMPREVRGLDALRAYARAMLGQELARWPGMSEQAATLGQPDDTTGARVGRAGLTVNARQLTLFGGKGGVGKTTVAAATGVHLARAHPGTKTLLFSTDPAHSLSDSLDQPIGNRITAVDGVAGLYAFEMEASELLDELNRTYVAEINEVFDAFLGGPFDAPYDRQVMEALVTLTPPGVDELMALMKVMELMDEGAFDRYVLDMAPTGHALRFLEMPAMMREWFIAFFRLLIKYAGVVSLTKVAGLLRDMSKQLRRVERLLVDAERCAFVAVTIPEAMAVAETQRLLSRLDALSVACGGVVVNMIVPPDASGPWEARRSEQLGYLRELTTVAEDLVAVPLFPHEIRGVAELSRLAHRLYGGDHG
jgi:arsenite/tail-anchored protein-transporting ATPase